MKRVQVTTGQGEEQSDNGQNILVVIPHPDTRAFILEAILEGTSYHVFCAKDDFWAMQVCLIVRPQMFILEHHVPETDGIQLYQHLHAKKELEAVPALFVSAGHRVHCHAIEECGLDVQHIPCGHDELLTTIQRVLASTV